MSNEQVLIQLWSIAGHAIDDPRSWVAAIESAIKATGIAVQPEAIKV